MPAITARAIVADLQASHEARAVEVVCSKIMQTDKVKSVWFNGFACNRYRILRITKSTETRLKLINNNIIKNGQEFSKLRL